MEGMDSILTLIKKLLGIEPEVTNFDVDITIHINSVLMILTQAGVGPATGFVITGPDEKWTDFLGDTIMLESVKTYIYQKVRLIFDPPTIATVLEAMERNIAEFEWRLNAEADKPVPVPVVVTEEEVWYVS